MNNDEKINYIKELGNECAILRKAVTTELGQTILDTAAVMSAVIGSGGKILITGNGGSAADASHFAGEMIVRLSSDKNRQ